MDTHSSSRQTNQIQRSETFVTKILQSENEKLSHFNALKRTNI